MTKYRNWGENIDKMQKLGKNIDNNMTDANKIYLRNEFDFWNVYGIMNT